jgi:hypothetical protein
MSVRAAVGQLPRRPYGPAALSMHAHAGPPRDRRLHDLWRPPDRRRRPDDRHDRHRWRQQGGRNAVRSARSRGESATVAGTGPAREVMANAWPVRRLLPTFWLTIGNVIPWPASRSLIKVIVVDPELRTLGGHKKCSYIFRFAPMAGSDVANVTGPYRAPWIRILSSRYAFALRDAGCAKRQGTGQNGSAACPIGRTKILVIVNDLAPVLVVRQPPAFHPPSQCTWKAQRSKRWSPTHRR